MRLGRLHHVGIVTPSIERSFRFYHDVMGASTFREPVDMPGGKVRIGFVHASNSLIELIQPLDDASDIATFLSAHPQGGQHHLCYEARDIHEARAWFAERGARFKSPIQTGILGQPIFFMDAGTMDGVLTEIIEIRD